MGRSQMVRHGTLVPAFPGSNPGAPDKNRGQKTEYRKKDKIYIGQARTWKLRFDKCGMNAKHLNSPKEVRETRRASGRTPRVILAPQIKTEDRKQKSENR